MKTKKTPFTSPDDACAPLSLRALLSQLIMIEVEGTAPGRELIDSYARNPWGGIILFGKNIADEEQLRGFTRELAEMSEAVEPHVPMFIAVDHEGGIVTRFAFPSTVPLCGNMALGAAGSADYAEFSGTMCGLDLRALGINTNFAPDVDVNNNPANPIIGARSFGESPAMVRDMGRAYIRGLRAGGVIPSAKHFPGHGDTSYDSHASLATIPHPMERLEKIELPPFLGAIEEQVEMIMTAHITFPALEPSPGIPATLSHPVLTGFLRNRLGYRGVIITDSMAMHAIKNNFGYGEAAVMAIEAGVDMVMLCGTREEQLSGLDALEKAVESGRISLQRIRESFARLYELRKRLNRAPAANALPREEVQRKMKQITLSSITLVKNEGALLPLGREHVKKAILVMPSRFPLSPLGEARLTPTLHTHIRPRVDDLKILEYDVKAGTLKDKPDEGEISAADVVIFAAFCNGRLPAAHREMVEQLLNLNRRLVVASLNSPYVLMDVPAVPAYLNCYNYGDLTMEALTAILFGDSAPTGKLPVSLPGLYEAGHFLTYEG